MIYLFLIISEENILEFLLNIKNKVNKYKYICIINSKHYKNISYYREWKNYIYNNLLGNSHIISEIITDFEKNEKLGIIFPEKYYKSLAKFGDYINDLELKYLNLMLNKINPKVNITQTFMDFPEGNMFWAKIRAIYPIFNLYSNLMLSGIPILILKNNLEKVWIYIVTFSGFLYKTIFKHL